MSLWQILKDSGYDPDVAPFPGLPSLTKGYNAALFTGATNEAKITAAIAKAVTDGKTYVWVPQSMLPYNASLVTFNAAVRMIREGSDPTAWDVIAYGADWLGVLDAGVAWNAARAGVPSTGGTVLATAGTYKLTTAFVYGSFVQLVMLPGVVLTGTALPDPATNQSLLDYRQINLPGGSTALTFADNYLALIVGINFGGQPRFQIGSNYNATPGQTERLEYLAEFGLGSNTTSAGPAIVLSRTRGTLPGNALHNMNNDVLGSIWFTGRDQDSPLGTQVIGAKIVCTAFGDWSATASGARFIFMVTSTTAHNAYVSAWEMRGDTHLWPSTDAATDIGEASHRLRNLHSLRAAWARNVITYGANLVLDAGLGMFHEVIPTNGTAFTFNAPINNPSAGGAQTQRIAIRIKNTFGTLGAVTWTGGAGGYRLGAAWTQPLNGFSRTIEFDWDGTNWIEAFRGTVDVAN